MQLGILEPLVILAAAAAGGFCSSAPLGAINLWASDKILTHREARLRWFLIGVISMDCVHASLAAWGYSTFLNQGPVARWIAASGGGFLIVLGLVSFLTWVRAKEAAPMVEKSGARPVNDFLLGSFLCGANPAFLLFWVFAIDQVARHVEHSVVAWRLVVFLLGVIAGDAVWFTVLLKVVRKGRDAVRPVILQSVRAGVAMAFVLAGGFTLYHAFRLP